MTPTPSQQPAPGAGPRGRPRGRVVLHVGLPKTGTTWLQRLVDQHRDVLREAGLHYPNLGPGAHFRGALEVRGSQDFFGITADDVAGSWERLCAQAREFGAETGGTTLLSHEVLAGASPEEVARALEPLEGLEVHVAVTARDLGRLVTAQWQERVKLGDVRSFADWQAAQVAGPWRPGEDRAPFWHRVDPADTLARWTAGLPADRGHLVVAPRPGAAPGALWERFASALGVDPRLVDPTTATGASNASLGATEVAVLRQVHVAVGDRLDPPATRRAVKKRYAEGELARAGAAAGSAPARTPYALRPKLLSVTATWRDQVSRAGWLVHGELNDLDPVTGGPDDPHPDDVPRGRVADYAARGTAERLVVDERARTAEREREERRARGEEVPEPGPAGPPARLADRLLRRPLLSVVVPAWGTEAYLDACLASVLGSTHSHLEVVVVDDGSPDASGEVAEAWARRDRRVRVLHVDNGGLGAARNVGVVHATGELLAFCDSDDTVPREAYAAMVAALKRSGSDFVTGSIARDEGGALQQPPWMRRLHAQPRHGLAAEDHPELLGDVFAWNKVFRRSWWDAAGRDGGPLTWPEGIRYEDQPTTTRAYLAGRFDVLPDVVYHWRTRDDGSSITQQRASLADLEDRFETKRMVRDAVREHGSLAVEKAALDLVLPGDMHRYFTEVPRCDDAWWALLVEGVRDLWGERSLVHSGLPPVHRLVGWLVEQDRRRDAARVVRHATAMGGPLPRVPDGEVGLRLDLPPDLIDVASVPPLALAVREHEA